MCVCVPVCVCVLTCVQMFSVMFICLVAYLDLLCWTVLTGPWLFLLASSCVWFEMMRSTGECMVGPLLKDTSETRTPL